MRQWRHHRPGYDRSRQDFEEGEAVMKPINAPWKSNRPRRCVKSSSGQSLVEFAMTLPLFLLMVLGVIEVSYALYDQHIITRLSREGSNLISRDTTLQDAGTAMISVASPPVNFQGNGSKLIFSAIRRATSGRNAGQPILYQRYEIGGLAAQSLLTTRGTGAFGGPPDFVALDPNNDVALQITNLPSSVALSNSGLIFLTEVYNTHALISPFEKFGLRLPATLYSSAYF